MSENRAVDYMEDIIDPLLMRKTPGKYIAQMLVRSGFGRLPDGPRIITTADELDALPAGSVVLSDAYRHYGNEMQVSFQRWYDGLWHRGGRTSDTHPDNFLPATLIHEPEASK